jgi:PAS domain S-box-containing protein
MGFHASPVSLSMLFSAAVAFGIACYGLTHIRVRGARELVICSLMVTVWAASNAMEYSVSGLSALIFWTDVQYFAYAISPLCWFVLIFRFNGMERYLRPRNILLLSILPAATSILVWFDPALGLVRHSFSVGHSGGLHYLAKEYGPWFWVHYVYSYGFNLADLCFLVAAVGKRGSLFRRQSIYILISVSLVFGTNLAYVLGWTPIRGVDFSSVAIGFSALVLWWGIFRHDLFRIPPVARAKIFELMANGLLVVDEDWNLLDSNEAARRMLGLSESAGVGKSVRDRLPSLAAVTGRKLPPGEGIPVLESLRWEIRMGREAEERVYELAASRLQDRAYKNAWVIEAEDVTDLRRAREEIIRQREELAVAADRDRLSKDLHDTLGQVLSFAVIQSGTILREMGRGNHPLAASYVERVRDILKDAHEDLRDFVRGIRMSEYGAVSLAGILEREAERFRQGCGIEVAVSVSAPGAGLTALQKNHIASVVKEALNNIAKHANASRVAIDFARAGEDYLLSIEDDGLGVDASAAAFATGSGIGIMRERAASIGGELELGARPGGGARVALRLPAGPGDIV